MATTPYPGAPWLPAQMQVAPSGAYPLGVPSADVRCSLDPKTALYTDLDTGAVRTWWQQQNYVRARNMRYARELAKLRQVNSDMQALWGRKPEFRDNWYDNFIQEYRLPPPQADLRRLTAVYGGPPPWPNGPMPGQFH